METRPEMATECGVFAGIHTARCGGTTQMPPFVRNVMTPLEANRSWSSGCECSGMKCPSSRSAETLARSATRRPFRAISMLWHLCDISCHFSERSSSWQVMFLTVQIALEEENMLDSGKMVGFI